ncbi:hypothetical protein [Halocatena marina]|uniref:Uncharacterized protein n=1 Tax=Halocatena marina TaxID=2934937 RepID=A0ABD5YNI3_9EURY|nr:hypothetical protein [Halocatena marina]
MKRRDFLTGGAAIVCGTGVANAAGGWNTVQPQIEPESGVGSIHRSSTQYVVDDLGTTDQVFSGRFITEPPERRVFTDAAVNDGSETFQQPIEVTNFDTEFLLLFEARMATEDRFGVYSRFSPEWIGWRTVSLPLSTHPWGEIGPEHSDAEALVYTGLMRFSSDATPSSGRAVVYNSEGTAIRKRFSISSH